MALSDLTDRNAVLKAIEEFDSLGRESFLSRYGFGPARSYFLVYQGRHYDSKAIVGAAHKFQFPEEGQLKAEAFSGGDRTVLPCLRSLGFEVVNNGSVPPPRQVWAFLAKPSLYNIIEAVRHLEHDLWTIGRSKVRAEDYAVIWQGCNSKGNRGIVALGQVESDPVFCPDTENPFWFNPKLGVEPSARVAVRYVSAPNLPLWIDKSEVGEFLASLSVARAQGGTVFKITQGQWDRIVELAGGWNPPDAGTPDIVDPVETRPISGGQGLGLNAMERKAVELHAMDLARQYLEQHWDKVFDVSAGASYDFLCRRGAEELRVEVKGTMSDGSKIILTKNEVDQAHRHDYAVFVVSGVQLDRSHEPPVASGGTCKFFSPWQLEHHTLKPLSYVCELDPNSGHPIN